jgi:hypothetical protein
VYLVRSGELAPHPGGRTGLECLLADLNRVAHARKVPGRAASWGFTWDREDSRSRLWWPQGITSSADMGSPDELDGRSVLVTSAYSRDTGGPNQGTRLSFVDITDRSAIRYRHVLLVETYTRDGGIVWHGPYLHVAATARGIYTFRLEDIVRSPEPVGGSGFGHEYVLPLRFRYDAHAATGHPSMRYSFLSLDRSSNPHQLVAGEYGRRRQTTRLVGYEIDPSNALLRADSSGVSWPLELHGGGVPGMQGATVVDGTYYVTTSNGRYGRGSLWVGRPGALKQIAKVLPAGVEDVTYWPSCDRLWSLTEYPGRRYVYTLGRPR